MWEKEEYEYKLIEPQTDDGIIGDFLFLKIHRDTEYHLIVSLNTSGLINKEYLRFDSELGERLLRIAKNLTFHSNQIVYDKKFYNDM